MLSEYNGEFQHRFRSKYRGYIFQNLPPKKNLVVILFILIPEWRHSNAPLNQRRAELCLIVHEVAS